ncbi:hypothetical protein, partial [Burkholderia sp. BC1]|uniref:hypothetical protein n=1 Tax=Burkholderia sp. BC1 TaxID=1095370 RepID=UPI004043A0CF
MADYSKNLAERFSNRGPKVGYCAICRTHGPLTADHVPPKNCGNINDSIFTDVYGPSPERPRKPVMLRISAMVINRFGERDQS